MKQKRLQFKRGLASCVVLTFMSATLSAAEPAATQPASQPTTAPAGVPPEEMETLVGPIALYPDVLLAQLLPASTFPIDIVKAARWLRDKPDMSKLPEQDWDLSVLALCHYPDVIYTMDKDLDWTNALGAAFLDQPNDVFDAIQRLREKAQKNGSLQTNEQQTIVIEQETIQIVPAQQEVVYVPTYNPQVVYVEHHDNDAAVAVGSAAIGFGAGLALGAWLNNDCDWHHGGVYCCTPGYWGGWAYRGSVHYGNDWAAAVGPRRGLAVGENGGIYRGPRGGAVWTDNGRGAVWSRSGATPYGRPAYTGRYSSYNNYRGNTAIGNNVNINRNNINVDRGDRAGVNRGNGNFGFGGNRTSPGQGSGIGSGNLGTRSPQATPYGGGAFSSNRSGLDANRAASRGLQSRTGASQLPAGGSSAYRPSAGNTARPSVGNTARPPVGNTARPAAGNTARSYSAAPNRSSYSNFSGASQARSYSSRGSASRSSAGISRGGGRAGGGGGRRR